MRTHTRKRGFTLVEVMVSAILLMIGVIGTFAFFTFARASLSIEGHRRIAAEIAMNRQEQLRGVDYSNLPSYQEVSQPVALETLVACRDTSVVDVDDDSSGSTDYRRITVTVRWDENRLSHSVELVTFMSSFR